MLFSVYTQYAQTYNYNIVEVYYIHGIAGSDFDKKTLITLNGGGSWTRNFRSYTATIPQTAFNITGSYMYSYSM